MEVSGVAVRRDGDADINVREETLGRVMNFPLVPVSSSVADRGVQDTVGEKVSLGDEDGSSEPRVNVELPVDVCDKVTLIEDVAVLDIGSAVRDRDDDRCADTLLDREADPS